MTPEPQDKGREDAIRDQLEHRLCSIVDGGNCSELWPNAPPKWCSRCLGLAAVQQRDTLTAQVADLREALLGILEIGKRDMSNPKYDEYFESAWQVLGELNDPKPRMHTP
jgi:hypothetical protein